MEWDGVNDWIEIQEFTPEGMRRLMVDIRRLSGKLGITEEEFFLLAGVDKSVLLDDNDNAAQAATEDV